MSFGFGFSLPTLGWHLSGGGASSGYSVTKSLRFRASASAYLNRTFGTPTSGTTWTWSGWVKRGALGSLSEIFTGNSAVNITALEFQSSDTLYFQIGNGTTAYSIGTNAVFRDPAAWYHISIVADTTQASGTITGISTDRIKMYINGVQVTSFIGGSPTPPPQNYTGDWNASSGAVGNIGRWTAGAARYFDGEMAEVNFVDGQALAPTAFGATGANSQWLPKAYTGTYGTNGFYLPFTNTTSTSTLVADSSGNGNNWTPNNISLTAGPTYDSLTDVPTLTSATVANYAVLNPLAQTSALVLSNGNLMYATSGAAAYANTNATIQMPSTGKWYFEVYINTLYYTGTGYHNIKIGINGSDGFYGIDATDGTSQANYTITSPTGGSYDPAGLGSSGGAQTMMVAYDAATGKLWLGAKGNWSGGGSPSAGTTPTYTTAGTLGTYFPRPIVYQYSVGSANFGQQPFTYTAPTGFLPLNTYNIAAGTVTTSGTFTGNLSTDGPMVYLNGTPTTMTINGNAVTFGTQADKLANGFKVRSSSASYNASGSNTYVATTVGAVFKYENAQSNP